MASWMEIADAAQNGRLVRFARPFEDPRVCGYILNVGEYFFLLALVSDHIWFDGFECFRIADVADLREDVRRGFVQAALERRGEQMPPRPPINLSTIDELLLSAGRAFPLVAIHCEERDPDVCHIGRVVSVTDGRLQLLEIDPDAVWDLEPTIYPTADITRVNFGGDYEAALYLVGEEPAEGEFRGVYVPGP